MTATGPMQSEPRELVAFRLGAQEFCLDIRNVREIRGWTPATILPHAPRYVLGVINLRGAVVPILNLAERLGLGSPEPNARQVIIIAGLASQIIGILVDAVFDILTVPQSSIQPTPHVASETAQAFVKGVIAVNDRMLRLVDLDAVFPASRRDDI